MFRKDSTVSLAAKGAIELPAGTVKFHEEWLSALIDDIKGQSPRELWRQQHNIRMVVDFLARNIAQLGLHAYQPDGKGGRERVRDSVVSELLETPNARMTTYDLIVSLVSDIALFDEAWWLVRPTSQAWEIRPLAVDRISILSGNEFDGNMVISYFQGENKKPLRIKQDQLLHFRGWDPSYSNKVSPAVRTLKNILAEQVASQEFRLKVWENGGQISSYISRPKDAPDWSDEAASRFREDMGQYRSGKGAAGKMPVLEDGMTINQTRFNAKDEQWAEAAQLALETVARTFHINPAMLGATGGVSYANVKEFRKMLYGETLGPWLKMFQDRLNRFLLPMIGEESGVYLEFNVKAKLAASFEEQASVMSSAVGRPWMTANEARALENMPALDGDADALVTPLNVLVGGQASPLDSAPKSGNITVKAVSPKFQMKAEPDQESTLIMAQVLSKFFARQRDSVLSKLSAGGEWWDAERWDKELAEDLLKVAVGLFGRVGEDVLAKAGFDASELDIDRATAFLKAVSESRARMVNAATKEQLDVSMNDSESEAERSTPDGVFDLIESSRGNVIASTLLTTLAAFTTTEAAKQVAGSVATKRWVTNSKNPRSEHARMSGETVPVGEKFSNGSDWPGDPVLGADGVANCQCSVEIIIP